MVRGVSELRAPQGVWLAIDERLVPTETLWSRVGADVVVIETTVPSATLAITYTSTYLSSSGADTVVSHALAKAGDETRSWSREVAEGYIPGTAPRERVLLDHLMQLQDALIQDGFEVLIELDDDVAESANRRHRK